MANGRDTVPIHPPEYQRLRWLAAGKKKQAQQVPGPFGGVAEQRYQEIPAPTRQKMSPRQQQETKQRFVENERRRAEMLAKQGGLPTTPSKPGFIPRAAATVGKALWKMPLVPGGGPLRTPEDIAKTGMAGAERVARYAWTPVSALAGGMALDVTRGKSPILPGMGTGGTQAINSMLRSRLPERRDKRDNDTRPELPDTIQAFVNAIKAIQTEKGIDFDAATHAFQDTYHAPKYYFGAIEAILGLFIPPGAIGPAAGATRATLALAARASMKAAPGIKVAGQTLKWAAESQAYMGMGMGGLGGPPRIPKAAKPAITRAAVSPEDAAKIAQLKKQIALDPVIRRGSEGYSLMASGPETAAGFARRGWMGVEPPILRTEADRLDDIKYATDDVSNAKEELAGAIREKG